MSTDTKGVSLDEFIFRKLKPIRILRSYMANELELAEGDSIRISHQDYDNIVSTLEIFLEEYDRVSSFRGKGSRGNKKSSFIEAKNSAIKTIA